MTAPSGLIIVDKPGGMTSHDVVARVRRLAGTRRVGHAGTLDPMATGVLVIGVEKATRLLGYLTLTEKTYAATIRLGQSTSTDDAEGEPTGGSPATDIVPGALDAEIAELTGDIWQVPPGVSAIKVNGQRAYKLTRAGAYIRALARDLGAALGTGGHLTALRRTAVGPYDLAQAHTLQELEDQKRQTLDLERTGAPAAPEFHACPWITTLADAAAAAFPRLDLTAEDAHRLAQGARLPLPSDDWPEPGIPVAAFDPDAALVALVTAESGSLRSLAVFAAP
jgi:tRNA pseudouridine55 synthase